MSARCMLLTPCLIGGNVDQQRFNPRLLLLPPKVCQQVCRHIHRPAPGVLDEGQQHLQRHADTQDWCKQIADALTLASLHELKALLDPSMQHG